MKIVILPSDKGDCLILRGDDGASILIDGGMPKSYADEVRGFWKNWVKKNGDSIDLAYVSHIDQDHIGGMLKMLDDIAAWRVYEHLKNDGGVKPAFPKPPTPKHLWHNAFHDQVEDNSEEIESALAASAAMLSNSRNKQILALADEYREIATSIPEAIKLSRRASPEQLGIPLNKHFGGKLGMVRSKNKTIKFGNLSVRVIGPFKEDLEILRDEWNKWLKANRDTVRKLRELTDEQADELGAAMATPALGEGKVGDRKKVTAPNLASLMLLVEEAGKTVVLTGDGHCREVGHGLEEVGILPEGGGGHVNVLKIAHHGSENNTDRDFAKRLTADHYIFCGNGKHENPDLEIVRLYLESRLGTGDKLSPNPQAKKAFTMWFSSSPTSAGAEKAHMTKIQELIGTFAKKTNRLTVKFRKGASLELTV